MNKVGRLSIASLIGVLVFPFIASATPVALYSQQILLNKGWNVVSTPRVLDSHTFSAAENSTNFDIYVLDPSKASKWATLADLGQAEFTPLYGYFINNKTGGNQTLTFNYTNNATPTARLFQRSFTSAGWYSIGVANPSYAITALGTTSSDVDNPTNILASLSGKYSTALDLTDGTFAAYQSLVSASTTWKAANAGDINTLNDLRETKGYAVYITDATAQYSGFQNNDVPIGIVSVNASATSSSGNVFANSVGATLGIINIDASLAHENIVFSGIQVRESGTATSTPLGYLSGCQIYDGATALNTGSNIVNSISNGQNAFTFDNPLTVSSGALKTLTLKCSIALQAQYYFGDTYVFGVNSTGWTTVATSTPSGVSFATGGKLYVSSSTSNTMTLAPSGVLSASVDASSPSYGLAAGGTTGVITGVVKLHPANESMTLTKLGMRITTGTSTDIQTVKLYNGATLIGTANFAASAYATSTLSTPLALPADQDTLVTIKTDVANIGIGQSGVEGDLLKLDPWGYEATGDSSGLTIRGNASTGVAGIRLFRSFPTLAVLSVPTNTLSLGTNDLYRFSVTANAVGDVALNQVTPAIATSSGSAAQGTTTVTQLKIYAYSDSGFTSPIGGPFVNGLLNTAINPGYATTTIAFTNVLQIPAGQTYYFRVMGTVTQVAGTSGSAGSVSTYLAGDGAFAGMAQATGWMSTGNSTVWSPIATSSSIGVTDNDWTNGYMMPGLPTSGTTPVTLTK